MSFTIPRCLSLVTVVNNYRRYFYSPLAPPLHCTECIGKTPPALRVVCSIVQLREKTGFHVQAPPTFIGSLQMVPWSVATSRLAPCRNCTHQRSLKGRCALPSLLRSGLKLLVCLVICPSRENGRLDRHGAYMIICAPALLGFLCVTRIGPG